MKKSILCLLIVMILGLTLAATACGKNGESGNNDEPSASVSEVFKTPNVAEKEKTLRIGESYKITADGDGKLSFVSSDVSVASVSDNGTVTAISDGTAFITVSGENAEVTCRINVIKANDYIRLGKTETGVVKGGEVVVEAEIIENGKKVNGDISFTSDSDDLKIAKNKNTVTLCSDKTGYYVVTASYKTLTAKITVKVVNENAKTLASPVLTTKNCVVLKWNAVNFADGYRISVNGGTSIEESGTAFDISEYTKNLEYGEKAVIAVSAVAKNNFDCLDGLPEMLVFAHDYEEEVIVPYTCTNTGKVKYICAACGKNYEKDGILSPHKMVDGACEVCGEVVTEKVLYLYDKDNECYYVAGGDAGFDAEEVYILAKYDDGKNGEHPVTFVKNGAFIDNYAITKVILPESVKRLDGSVFQNCGNLRYVSMLGIEDMIFANIKTPYSDGLVTTNNNFLGCVKLTVLIVGEKFNLHPNGGGEQQFVNQGNTPCVDIYVYGKTVVDCSIGDNAKNGLLTGNVYYKGDSARCLQWNFDTEENIVHGPSAHNYVDGMCTVCGEKNAMGVRYEYNSEKKIYYVASYNGTNDAVHVFGTWDDGVNGEADVKYVAGGAFRDKLTIKKVILDENIDSLEGSVFCGCENLEYVSMTGITNLDYASHYGGERNNNFRNCFKLKTVVVSTALSSNVGQFGCGAADTGNKKILDFYVYGESGAPALDYETPDANNLCSGNVYYYSEIELVGAWHYVNGVATLW